MLDSEYPKVLSFVHPTKKIAIVKIMRNSSEAEREFYKFEKEFGFDVAYSVDHIDELYPQPEQRRVIGFQPRATQK
tara:strand:- start:351 stop:578 length:228 start_codon:yes stop_codon:yes gene_type:complete